MDNAETGGAGHDVGYECIPRDHHDDIVADLRSRLAEAEARVRALVEAVRAATEWIEWAIREIDVSQNNEERHQGRYACDDLRRALSAFLDERRVVVRTIPTCEHGYAANCSVCVPVEPGGAGHPSQCNMSNGFMLCTVKVPNHTMHKWEPESDTPENLVLLLRARVEKLEGALRDRAATVHDLCIGRFSHGETGNGMYTCNHPKCREAAALLRGGKDA